MSRSRTLWRLVWGLVLTLMLVLVLVIGAAGYLTATPQGIRFLLSQAERWVPGQLQVADIKGSLWGRLRLDGVAYRDAQHRLEVQHFYLDWEPAALLEGTLHIRTLTVGPVSATLPAGEPSPADAKGETGPLTLPDLRLPFQVRVDDLALNEVAVSIGAPDPAAAEAAAGSAVEIDQLRLSIHSEGDTLVVEQFLVEAPQGRLALDGTLTPRDDFALQLASDWRLQLPEREALSGQGPIRGSLARLVVSQQLSGLLNADVNAQLQLLQAEPSATVKIDEIAVDLGVAAPDLAGRTLTGELTLTAAGETLAVRGDLRAPLPELGASALALKLELSQERITIERLQLRREGEGASDKALVQLEGQVRDWLQDPQLDLQGQWEPLVYPLQGPARWHSEGGGFRLSGTPADYRLALEGGLGGESLPTGQWRLEAGGDESGLERLDLQGQMLEGELSLEGRVVWQPNVSWELALAGRQLNPGAHWSEWPGRLSFQASTEGRLGEEGTPQLSVELHELSGNLRDEPVQGRARVQFDGQTLEVEGLGQVLEGELALEGRVVPQPSVSWDLDLAGRQLNPGALWPEWPGRLSFQTFTQGRLGEEGVPRLFVELRELSGNLREEPVQGQARVQFDGQTLEVDGLELNVAGARLQADGVVGEALDLEWDLAVPRFDQLLAGAEGSLSAAGALRGPRDRPKLAATIAGEGLRWQGKSVARVSGDINLDLDGQQPSRLSLEALELDLDGQRWQQLLLRGDGTPEQHEIEAELRDGPLTLDLAVTGGWEAPQWQASLRRLTLGNDLLGQWQLQAPVALAASAAAADIGRLCLEPASEEESQLCVQGHWSAENGIRGRAEVEGVSLQRFDPWLPPGTQTQGALWAAATFSQPVEGRPRGQVQARIEGAGLWLPDEDLRLASKSFTLSGQMEESRMQAKLELALESPPGALNAQVQIEDLYGEGKLQGELQGGLSNLEFISLLVPQVRVLSGTLTSSLTLAGDYADILWRGQLQLNDGRADLPALGIRLDEVALLARNQEDGPGLSLEAGATSGEGRLTLQGHLDPLAGSGQLSLAGERFLAMATEDIQAWISPDITVEMDPELIKLRGELTVPEASIKPPRIEGSVGVSSDVVVVERRAPEAESEGEALDRTLDARLRLTLGDQVELEALGFQGRLQGSVVIVDDARRATRATGSLEVAAGEYRLYGQDLNISRGSLVFSGGPVDNPGLDLRVSREVDTVTVGARVGGTLRDPQLDLFSNPSMPESNILSYLLLGRPPGAGTSPSEQEMLRNAATALAIFGGNTLAENFQERLSVDELGLEGGDTAAETSLYIGKYLSPRLYVKYGAGLLEPTNTFFMRYRLGEGWSLESETGTKGSGGDLVYILER